MENNSSTPFVFFGTPGLAVLVLEELKRSALLPSLVVTAPDKPQDRRMQLKPSPVKLWAQENNIPVHTPTHFDEQSCAQLRESRAAVYIVVAYGKILPEEVLSIPAKGVLNVHPSLLPKYRGPSPVRSAILADDNALGVTVMLLDEKMDHGPIIAQEPYTPPEWPMAGSILEHELFTCGGKLLAKVLPEYATGNIVPHEQDHARATYCKLFKKEDGLLNLADNGRSNMLKFCAYDGWPGTYFFVEINGTQRRVKITDAHLEGGAFVIDEVIPEGKKKMAYTDFQNNVLQKIQV